MQVGEKTTGAAANLRPRPAFGMRSLLAALLGPEPSAGPGDLRQARDARTAVALFALSAAGVLAVVGLGGLAVVSAGVAALQLLTVAAIQVRLVRGGRRGGD